MPERLQQSRVDLPEVTIVMPSFNHGHFIREALDSVLLQDYPRLECIVVDGGSSDGTLQTLDAYADRIRWMSEPDDGIYDAVNKGWRMASGEWLGWLNCDDALLPGAISRLIGAALSSAPPADFVYGDYHTIDRGGEIVDTLSCGPPDANSLLRYGNRIFTGATLVQRGLAERLGFFDQRYALSADYAFLVRAVATGRPLHIAAPTAMFRVHADSKSQNSSARMWAEALAISEELSGKKHLPLRARAAGDLALQRLLSPSVLADRRIVAARRFLRRVRRGG